jgi:hypothetical protein
LYGRTSRTARCAIAGFLTQIETATVQRPIFAAADLENHLRAPHFLLVALRDGF